MSGPSRWRYVPPNLVTCLNIVLGVLAVQAVLDGRPVGAAWLALIVVLTDKLDGLLAKRLGATSEFGVQLDSLADQVAFGVVPATVYYGYFARRADLVWGSGGGKIALAALCALHVVAGALRLARFNVAAAGGEERHYRGVPTTFNAGFLLVSLLTAVKYGGPGAAGAESLDPWRLFGGADLSAALTWLPLLLPIGAVAMVSPLRVPRLGRTRWRLLDAVLLLLVVVGVVAGFARRLPEFLWLCTATYFVGSVVYHVATRPK